MDLPRNQPHKPKWGSMEWLAEFMEDHFGKIFIGAVVVMVLWFSFSAFIAIKEALNVSC